MHLHHIAGRDVFLGLADRLQVIALGKLAVLLAAHAGACMRRFDRPIQPRLQFTQSLPRLRIGLALARVGIHDQVNAAREVIDDRNFFGEQKQDVGHADVVGLRLRELLFDHSHRVVAEIAGQSTGKARQPGAHRHLELVGVALHRDKRVAVERLRHDAAFDNFGRRAIAANKRANRRACGQPDKRIAAEALASDDRFQQERVRLVGELQVQRQRRFKVREAFRDQRNAVVALRRKRLEFEFSHVMKPIAMKCR